MKYTLNTPQEVLDFNSQIKDLKQTGILGTAEKVELYLDNGDSAEIPTSLMQHLEIPEAKYNPILYGKNSLERIVGAESDGDQLYLFIQNGKDVETKIIPNRLWVCSNKNLEYKFKRLDGDRFYKYINYYQDLDKWNGLSRFKKQMDLQKSYCPVESNFISRGFTYFKGMALEDISVLSFDIETSGLVRDNSADVYLITNTFRNGDHFERKLFNFLDYGSRREMIQAWCTWVREKNPSIMLGHNIYMYDLPYLDHVARLNDCTLDIGRDGSSMTIGNWPSKFRKDGNEQIKYFRSKVWGRELIDTYFLSYKYDIGRKYDSNGLKQIIKQEGLEKEGRVFVDASKIRFYKDDPEMWKKVCQYACFKPDVALISKSDGTTELIENLKVGDQVISHDGSNQYVYRKIEQEYKGKVYSLTLEGGRKIHGVTEEHPFYVLDETSLTYKWVQVKNLKQNQLLVRGESKVINDTCYGKYNLDHLWLFGLFQADGYIRINSPKHNSIVLTCHEKEEKTITAVLIKNNLKYSILKKAQSKGRDIVISDNKLAHKFLNWSGGKFKSYEKRVSKEFFQLINSSKTYFMNFLGGILDGDACMRYLKGNRITLWITSPHLVNTIDICSAKHGINSTRKNLVGTKLNYTSKKQKAIIGKYRGFELVFFEKATYEINSFLKIKQTTIVDTGLETFKKHVRIDDIEIEDYEGKVYNVSISETNTYIVNGIVSHNCEDSDDALKLFDLMAPSFFYFTQMVPMKFDSIVLGASGSQLNSILLRAYLQEGKSVPKASLPRKFQGAISHSVPGIYENIWKVDIASQYPSIIRQYELYNKDKDPDAIYLYITNIATEERLKNKALGETNKYYRDLEQSQKIIINSLYGMCGAPGLNFNDFDIAEFITNKGRDIIDSAIVWATGKDALEWGWEPKELEGESDEV